ncbi:MAG: ubiquinone/menaquinone biosynthesis methyltransferase [Desulfarculaceae bacterium]|nr:ubiquinone/menaquinone biosynthesis methyltransferase [Desulfarculaceae bacterium]
MASPVSFIRPPAAADPGPREHRALVQAHFDAVAKHYDLANSIMSLGLHHAWKIRAVAALDSRPGQRLADICGGTADLALLAQRRRSSGSVVVYDLNQAMLSLGRAKAARSPHGRGVQFARGDAHRLALADASLDGVMVGFGVRNLGDMAQGFREMARVLKPGGRLVCLEFSRPRPEGFARLYDLYSALMMPLVGRVFTGSWRTYSHLTGTIRRFPGPEGLGRIIEEAGFARVSWQRLSLGIACIHQAVKP